jgi:Carboxypeptidase regulatory-like domain
VIDSESRAGIPSAAVQFSLGDDVIAEISTDEHGLFSFDEAKSGYRVTAKKNGYVHAFPPENLPKTVNASDFEESGVTLTLTPACAISGRVLDSSGEPARGAKVMAMARRAGPGGVRFSTEGASAEVDDRGIYRIFNLPPGRYSIAVAPDSDSGSAASAPSYFPGVIDPARAEFLSLRAGETRSNTNLTLTAVQSYAVKGTVAGIPGNWPHRRVAVSMIPAAGISTEAPIVDTDLEGHFTFSNVASGSYQIVASGPGPTVVMGNEAPVPDVKPRQGSVRVDIAGADLTDVTVSLKDVVTVDGRFVADRETGVTPACYSAAKLTLRPADAMPVSRQFNATLTSAGSFTLRDIAAGRYRVELKGLEGACFLKEVQVDGKKQPEGAFPVDGNVSLALVVSAGSGKVTGTVTAPDEPNPTPGLVILAPVDDETREVRTTPFDAKGQFNLDQIPPGRYRLLATQRIGSNDYLDPLFWQENQAPEIEIKQGSSITQDLKITK